ncbi:MAG: hypothetical protein IID61_13705, partial [SAR324 cluster bacterium]|nr:hypothetical protein [SAR324 cluster bacterium]
MFWFVLSSLQFSCALEKDDLEGARFSGPTGGITANIVFSDVPASLDADHSITPQAIQLPDSVVTIRAIVSAEDMEPLEKVSDVSLGADEIDEVPVGLDRTLTLQGLDSEGGIDYEGVETGITVMAGETTDIGEIVLNLVQGGGDTGGGTDGSNAGFTISETSLATIENGSPQSFTIRPNSDPGTATITVDISSSDPTEGTVAPQTLSWTSSDHTTAKTVTVTPVDDPEIDGSQTYNIVLDPSSSTETAYAALPVQSVSVTNSDDDTEGFTIDPDSLSTSENGSDQTFTVRPNTDPGSATVTISIVSMDPTEGLVSPATLSWTSGDYTNPKTVTVSPEDDIEPDGPQTYDIRLDPAASSEAGYAALGTFAVSVTNSDDDTIGFTFTPTSISTMENGTSQTFLVRPDTDPGDDTITVNIDSSDASEGSVGPASISWTTDDYTTDKTVTVTPENDSDPDGPQTYNIRLNPSTSTEAGYAALAIQTVSVTNADDDSIGFTFTPTNISTSESGVAKTFTLHPNTDPGADNITVLIDSSDTTEGSVSPSSLIWTSQDFLTEKTVTVTPIDDDEIDGAAGYNVRLNPATSANADYAGLGTQTVAVTNADDDSAGFTFSPTSLSTSEDGTSKTFTVVPNTDPGALVINLVISRSDLTEGTVSPDNLSWDTDDYTTAKDVTVTPIDDPEDPDLVDFAQTYDIILDPTGST